MDSSAITNWTTLSVDAKISHNGRYVSYTIENQPVNGSTLVILTTDSEWNKEFVGYTFCSFSDNNNKAVIQKDDSLIFIDLDRKEFSYITNVRSFKQPGINKGEWLAYNLKDTTNTLLVRNLLSGKEMSFANVSDYLFSEKGNSLLIRSSSRQDAQVSQKLIWVDLATNVVKIFWSSLSNR